MILDWIVPLAAALIGAIVCRGIASIVLGSPGQRSMRTNVDGREVPVVLAWAVVGGSLFGLTVAVFLLRSGLDGECEDLGLCLVPSFWQTWAPAAIPLSGMFLAGLWDDRRGDERPRGFGGHLSAVAGGAVTGGVVKVIAGVIVGLWTAALLLTPSVSLVLAAVVIALCANLLNLFDRAPGRANKVFLLLAIPLALLGTSYWRSVAAGAIGAVLAALPLDLRARGMLGDAGANPLGALLGLGLVMLLGHSVPSLGALVVVLLALNLASEKWSFSRVIENTPWLARLDHLGRK